MVEKIKKLIRKIRCLFSRIPAWSEININKKTVLLFINGRIKRIIDNAKNAVKNKINNVKKFYNKTIIFYKEFPQNFSSFKKNFLIFLQMWDNALRHLAREFITLNSEVIRLRRKNKASLLECVMFYRRRWEVLRWHFKNDTDDIDTFVHPVTMEFTTLLMWLGDTLMLVIRFVSKYIILPFSICAAFLFWYDRELFLSLLAQFLKYYNGSELEDFYAELEFHFTAIGFFFILQIILLFFS